MGSHRVAWWSHCFAVSCGILSRAYLPADLPGRGKVRCWLRSNQHSRCNGKQSPQLERGAGFPHSPPLEWKVFLQTNQCHCSVLLIFLFNSVFHARGLAKYFFCTMSCPEPEFGTHRANSVCIAGLLCSGAAPFVGVLPIQTSLRQGHQVPGAKRVLVGQMVLNDGTLRIRWGQIDGCACVWCLLLGVRWNTPETNRLECATKWLAGAKLLFSRNSLGAG